MAADSKSEGTNPRRGVVSSCSGVQVRGGPYTFRTRSIEMTNHPLESGPMARAGFDA
jgi:hypothetical protein